MPSGRAEAAQLPACSPGLPEQDALGGNSRTVMIAHISPASTCFEESRTTLLYAYRAKNIKTRVRCPLPPWLPSHWLAPAHTDCLASSRGACGVTAECIPRGQAWVCLLLCPASWGHSSPGAPFCVLAPALASCGCRGGPRCQGSGGSASCPQTHHGESSHLLSCPVATSVPPPPVFGPPSLPPQWGHLAVGLISFQGP